MNIQKRITPALDALGGIKNLTLAELLPVLEALNEKCKSSQDYETAYERDFLCEGMFDDLIAAIIYFMSRRNERADAAEREREDIEENGSHREKEDAYYGDRSNAFEGVVK